MPARPTLPPPPATSPQPSPKHHHHHHKISTPITACAATAAASLFIFLTVLLRKLKRRRRHQTSPPQPQPLPRHYSYSFLRRATASFSPSLRLGQGGFGSVYRASSSPPLAVKLMDSNSLQGEREFNNEIFFASKLDSPYVVKVLGFCSDPKRRRMLVVYELMCNGNLQDALLVKKCEELRFWEKRFCVAVDVAKGIEYLHGLDPVVIHGDVKPSNVLLDVGFSAKIGDFGLARLKESDRDQFEVSVLESAEESGVEESESVITTTTTLVDQSPESFARVAMTSPETVVAPVTSPNMGGLDCGKRDGKGVRSSSVKDWWWKQDSGGGGGGGGETGVVKDYVMEWIGSEIKKEGPNGNLVGVDASTSGDNVGKVETKKTRRRLDWWISMDDEMTGKNLRKDKRRPVREWWKDDELAKQKKKKKKKKKKQTGFYSDDNCGEDWSPQDEELCAERKKKSKNRSRSSRGSVDWWLDGLSGELWRARRNSYDSMNGEIPKSGGISSTPSMRGTVCYVAPEYGGGGDLSEKCDVYSYGVLLLVLIAGRRPLQVTGSHLAEFHRANLISWARHLARKNKLLDLVDKSIVSLDREKALLCIIVALNCLQKSPVSRPSMKEVVGMLTGQLEPPHLPVELSPSPPSCYRYKSQKKVR